MHMLTKLEEVVTVRGSSLSINDIIEKVASFYGLTAADIRGPIRLRKLVRPRQVAMYLAREFLVRNKLRSFPEVGRRIGGRDHSTVIHSIEKVNNELTVNSVFAQRVEKLRLNIQLLK